MKLFRIGLILAVLVLPAFALAQVGDSTIAVPSPFEFDKIFTIDNIAKLFGVNPILFGVFVAMIFGLTEFVKRKVKKGGELFFTDNRSIPLPFVNGVFLAFIVPLNFTFWETIRFGIQGAIAAILVYIAGTFVFGGSPSRNP